MQKVVAFVAVKSALYLKILQWRNSGILFGRVARKQNTKSRCHILCNNCPLNFINQCEVTSAKIFVYHLEDNEEK